MSAPIVWTPREESYLRKYAGKMHVRDITNRYLPNRTEASVRQHAVKLKISIAYCVKKSGKPRQPIIDQDMLNLLELLRIHKTLIEVSRVTGVGLARVSAIARKGKEQGVIPSTGTRRGVPSVHQESVYEWVKNNPGKTSADCYNALGGATYENINAHTQLRKKKLIKCVKTLEKPRRWVIAKIPKG